MAIEIKVPVLPESVADATVATWYKKPGEAVEQDDNLVDIETDKVVLEVVAPESGVLDTIKKKEGETVLAEEVIGIINAGDASQSNGEDTKSSDSSSKSAPAEAASTSSAAKSEPAPSKSTSESSNEGPAARRKKQGQSDSSQSSFSQQETKGVSKESKSEKSSAPAVDMQMSGDRAEKRVPMTRLRAKIAERLLGAQQNAAILTTFNEINMQPVMDLRAKYKEQFEKTHGVKLGFMSFFAKAVIEALKRFPVVNASIDGNDIVYHGYFDLGVAVSSPRGLVVPIIRDADKLSMAGIEKAITEMGQRAKEGTLTIDEMTGGTFTVSNGGVFGSLMSTPILNPPQTGILGMHKIEQRAVVENGNIVARPMMYVALSYDHRLIDGAESVRFLVTIKEMLEDPSRLVLEI